MKLKEKLAQNIIACTTEKYSIGCGCADCAEALFLAGFEKAREMAINEIDKVGYDDDFGELEFALKNLGEKEME